VLNGLTVVLFRTLLRIYQWSIG